MICHAPAVEIRPTPPEVRGIQHKRMILGAWHDTNRVRGHRVDIASWCTTLEAFVRYMQELHSAH